MSASPSPSHGSWHEDGGRYNGRYGRSPRSHREPRGPDWRERSDWRQDRDQHNWQHRSRNGYHSSRREDSSRDHRSPPRKERDRDLNRERREDRERNRSSYSGRAGPRHERRHGDEMTDDSHLYSKGKSRRGERLSEAEDRDFYSSRHASRSESGNGKERGRDMDEATFREIKRLERAAEDEDEDARERRLQRLKRRRRSAGLETESEDDLHDGHKYRSSNSREQRSYNGKRVHSFSRGGKQEEYSDYERRGVASDLKRRLSAREIVDDSYRDSSRTGGYDRDYRDRSRRTHRDRQASPEPREQRRERSPLGSRKETRMRDRSSPSTSARGYREMRSPSPQRSSPLHNSLSRRIAGTDEGIRIAGSSSRRRNGRDSLSGTHRSPSPGVKLLRRRGSMSAEDAAPSETVREDHLSSIPGAVDRVENRHMESSDSMHSERNGKGPLQLTKRGDRDQHDLRLPRGRPDEIYERIAQVGEGTYGQVFKARSDRTGVIVALKRIRMEGERDGFPITAMREIKLLQGLQHENVVRLHEMMLSKHSVYMVFEYLHHDLNGVLSQGQIEFAPAHLKSLAAQLLTGLAYLHQHSILHRDLKCSNLLLSNEGTLKLADFGLARLYTKRARTPHSRSFDYTNRVVTLWYRAPELLLGETSYGDAIDVWGAGCIFLELFTRKPVFQGADEINQLQLLYDILGPITAENWPEAEDLPWFDLVRPTILATTGDDQDQTVSLGNTFKSLLSSDALDVAKALLTFSPHRRVSARDALALPYFAHNDPKPRKPADILQSVEGEWHEFESRRAKRDAAAQALHAHVHRERATEQQPQAKQSLQSGGEGIPEPIPGQAIVQLTPEIRTTGRTDLALSDQHDERNASA